MGGIKQLSALNMKERNEMNDETYKKNKKKKMPEKGRAETIGSRKIVCVCSYMCAAFFSSFSIRNGHSLS